MKQTISCVCLRRSTDDEVDHTLIRRSAILDQGGLTVEDLVKKECLETLKRCLNTVRGNHSTEPFTEKIL